MEAKECKRWDGCGAPICPLDKGSLVGGIWYPDEEICQLQAFCHESWIRNQKKISRKVRNRDYYFKLEMLSRNCIITAATEGLDPDFNDLDDNKAIERWLSSHPEKRLKSESELEILKKRFSEYRQGFTSDEKDQTAEQNMNLDGNSSRQI
jgi:hypothetical protein